jgi:hypothetical protein
MQNTIISQNTDARVEKNPRISIFDLKTELPKYVNGKAEEMIVRDADKELTFCLRSYNQSICRNSDAFINGNMNKLKNKTKQIGGDTRQRLKNKQAERVEMVSSK